MRSHPQSFPCVQPCPARRVGSMRGVALTAATDSRHGEQSPRSGKNFTARSGVKRPHYTVRTRCGSRPHCNGEVSISDGSGLKLQMVPHVPRTLSVGVAMPPLVPLSGIEELRNVVAQTIRHDVAAVPKKTGHIVEPFMTHLGPGVRGAIDIIVNGVTELGRESRIRLVLSA